MPTKKTMANIKYTESDIEYLRKHFADGNLEEISKKLNMGIGTMYQKAHKLGIKRNKANYSWTKIYDALLKNLYPTKDNVLISEKIGKSVSAIRNRAIQLGLKKAKHYWTPEQEKYLLENFKKLHIDELAQKLSKTNWACINKYRKLTGKYSQ